MLDLLKIYQGLGDNFGMLGVIKVKWQERMLFFLPAILIVALDQLTKHLVRVNIALGESRPENGIIRLTHISNTGGVWGLFAGHTVPLILTAVAGEVAILVCYYYFAASRRLLGIGLGLILGSAIGNMIDRLRFGYVTDFIDVGVWPVFNIADSAGVVGAAVIILFIIFLAREKKDSSPQLYE